MGHGEKKCVFVSFVYDVREERIPLDERKRCVEWKGERDAMHQGLSYLDISAGCLCSVGAVSGVISRYDSLKRQPRA